MTLLQRSVRLFVLALLWTPLFLIEDSKAGWDRYNGEWEGQFYEFNARYDSSWSDKSFYGSWGDQLTDITLSRSGRYLSGTASNESLDIYCGNFYVEGTLPCGKVDLDILGKHVGGRICEQDVNMYLSSDKDADQYAADLVSRYVSSKIPLPVQPVFTRHFSCRL